MEPIDFMAIHGALPYGLDAESDAETEDESATEDSEAASNSSSDTPSVVSSETEVSKSESETPAKAKANEQHTFTVVTSNLCKHLASTDDKRAVGKTMITRHQDMCVFQEALCPNTMEVVDGTLFWGGPRIGNSQMCNCIAVRLSKFRRVSPNKKLSTARLQVMEVRFHGLMYAIVNGHRPYKGSTCGTFAQFDSELAVVKTQYPERCLVLGDFNAQPDRAMAIRLGPRLDHAFEPFLATAVAADATLEAMIGQLRLMNFARPQRLNTWLDHPTGSTWHRERPTKLRRCYDLILVTPDLATTQRTLEVFRTGELMFNSDHFPMAIKIRAPPPSVPEPPKQKFSHHPGLQQLHMEHLARDARPDRMNPLSSKCIRRAQAELARQKVATAWANRTPAQQREIETLSCDIKRATKRLEKRNWVRTASQITKAADAGNLKRAFTLLNESLGRSKVSGSATQAAQLKAAMESVEALRQEAPAHPLDVSHLQPQPTDVRAVITNLLQVFTDGSKYRRARLTRAGAGVNIPQLGDASWSCQVPLYMRQTSAAGEVCAVLLALQQLRNLPVDTEIHIVSDCQYVVHVLLYDLERYIQQDFSDVAHPDLWRQIARELVDFPHTLTAEWIRSHTDKVDQLSRGNDRADAAAKQAAKGFPSHAPPQIDTAPVSAPVRAECASLLETTHAIQALNKKSASGKDPTPAAAVMDSPEAALVIHGIVKQVWGSESVPQYLADTILTFVPKANGDPRPITLVNTIIKVIANIIRARLRVIPLLPVQYGFQRARDTSMPIRVLRNAMNLAHSGGKPLYVVYIDFIGAYNAIHHDTLWRILAQHNVPKNLINIMKTMNAGETEIRDTDIKFRQTSGVPQGGPESPDLFNLAINAAIASSTLKNSPGMLLAFADDICIFGEDFDAVQAHLSSLEAQVTRLGLKFNTSVGKTEAMSLLPPTHARRYAAHMAAYAEDPTIGRFSHNPNSDTADTRDRRCYQILTQATHLWCPVCHYCQDAHTTPTKAAQLLNIHFRSAHPDLVLELPLPAGNSRLPFAPAPVLRDREPISPHPRMEFMLTAGVAPVALRWTLQYKYLGHIVDYAGNTGAAVHARRLKANGAFFSMTKLWDSPSAPTRIKVFIFEAMVRSTLLSGLETIVPSDTDIDELRDFYTMALRRITGLQPVSDSWGHKVFYGYDQLLLLTGTPDVAEILRDKRLNLAGRIARSDRAHPLHQLVHDQWHQRIHEDCQARGMNAADLADRYQCRKRLKRRNTTLFRFTQ